MTNPYNCTIPGNLFVGYKRLLQQLRSGFRNGNSYAVLGGRRCGKTSLLLHLADEIRTDLQAPLRLLPHYLDMQGHDRLTAESLFNEIYTSVVQEIAASPWPSLSSQEPYQCFLKTLDAAKPALDTQYGEDWVALLLVDELDTAIETLPDDQFFQNLRNLLMVSRFRRHFRLVASGVTGMAKLISSGSSPLNNLRNQHLGVLTEKQARSLIAAGFSDGVGAETELFLFQITGRHPYLLQGVLEKLWEERENVDKNGVKRAARGFLREHTDFHRWLDSFGAAEHAVYRLLAETPDGALHIRDLRQRIDPSLRPGVEDALTVLSYHGVIDDSDPEELRIAGTMFKDWYLERRIPTTPVPAPKPQRPQAMRVFISYAHEDDLFRKKLGNHLSLLKREGLIDVWHDRNIGAGQEWKNAIDDNLQAADIVLLLVSDDFLASDYCFDIEMQRALERHETTKARVIPIILRSVDWFSAPFGKLQALPKDAKPIMKWDDKDEAWTDVARGIQSVVEELRKR